MHKLDRGMKYEDWNQIQKDRENWNNVNKENVKNYNKD
jgi:hypothetical protein